jgi:hypothetical protein
VCCDTELLCRGEDREVWLLTQVHDKGGSRGWAVVAILNRDSTVAKLRAWQGTPTLQAARDLKEGLSRIGATHWLAQHHGIWKKFKVTNG